jgi:hypothetical protein
MQPTFFRKLVPTLLPCFLVIMSSFAGDQVTIYYEEGGDILDETVPWEEAKDFA